MTEQEKKQIEMEFAQTIISKLSDYQGLLSDNKKIKDREYKHMNTTIYGCKLVIRGVISEGKDFEVKLG